MLTHSHVHHWNTNDLKMQCKKTFLSTHLNPENVCASKQTLISLFIIHSRHLVRGIIVFEIVFTKSSKKKKGLNSYHASAQALSLGKTGLSSRYLRPF